jgi:hypothetical protein
MELDAEVARLKDQLQTYTEIQSSKALSHIFQLLQEQDKRHKA